MAHFVVVRTSPPCKVPLKANTCRAHRCACKETSILQTLLDWQGFEIKMAYAIEPSRCAFYLCMYMHRLGQSNSQLVFESMSSSVYTYLNPSLRTVLGPKPFAHLLQRTWARLVMRRCISCWITSRHNVQDTTIYMHTINTNLHICVQIYTIWMLNGSNTLHKRTASIPKQVW